MSRGQSLGHVRCFPAPEGGSTPFRRVVSSHVSGTVPETRGFGTCVKQRIAPGGCGWLFSPHGSSASLRSPRGRRLPCDRSRRRGRRDLSRRRGSLSFRCTPTTSCPPLALACPCLLPDDQPLSRRRARGARMRLERDAPPELPLRPALQRTSRPPRPSVKERF